MAAYSTYDDLALHNLLEQSDELAFREIYDRYWKLLFSIACAKLDSIEETEEIIQEIFADLWLRRQKIQVTRSLKYYLVAAVKYQVMTVLAKRHQKNKLQGMLPVAENEAPAFSFIEFQQLQQELESIISDLPERCQLIYRLSREEGYTNKQIAAELQISEKTVETQMTRALSRIRTGLGDAALGIILLIHTS